MKTIGNDGITVLSYRGSLAHPPSFSRFQTEIGDVSNRTRQFVLVDLSEATDLPNMAALTLFWAYERVVERAGFLVLAGMNECISSALLAMSYAVPVRITVEEARVFLQESGATK